MKKPHPLHGFLMFNTIIIFLMIGTLSAIIFPIFLRNTTQITMYKIRYQAKSRLDSFVKNQTKRIQYTCPKTTYNQFYDYDINTRQYRLIDHPRDKQPQLTVNTHIEPLVIYSLKPHQQNVLSFNTQEAAKVKIINKGPIIITQKQQRILGKIDQYGDKYFTIETIPPHKVILNNEKTILNLCRLQLKTQDTRYSVMPNPTAPKNIPLNESLQKFVNQATVILYKKDLYPTYQTPVVIAEKISNPGGSLTIQRVDQNTYAGSWLLLAQKNRSFVNSAIKFESADRSLIKDYATVSNPDWFHHGLQKVDFSKINFNVHQVIDLNEREISIDQLVELAENQASINNEALLMIRCPHDLTITSAISKNLSHRKIILQVEGSLTIQEVHNVPFDLILVEHNCTIHQSNLVGYLFTKQQLTISGNSTISLQEDNYFKNKALEPLFWTSSEPYQLGTIVYDAF